ncbi:hypothetical protein KIN20_003842 [Parelaphostrongylus tenuis]|uniref:Uncharacterized protein n=1 Tax=Parelaphostrongylus tenuis TaxID=148309 RepID=A0AAD5LXY9_PARTN|nr:hypothetical protein KIN20_003842 [Parelaphostrongylus tenuis]
MDANASVSSRVKSTMTLTVFHSMQMKVSGFDTRPSKRNTDRTMTLCILIATIAIVQATPMN